MYDSTVEYLVIDNPFEHSRLLTRRLYQRHHSGRGRFSFNSNRFRGDSGEGIE